MANTIFSTITTTTATTPSKTTTPFTLIVVVYAMMVLIAQPQSSLMHANAIDNGCNEYVCGSVVSKCLLTHSCQCQLSDSACCRECLQCLGNLFTDCCACLDMCPKHNDSLTALTLASQIGEFDGVPELFDALTAEDDDEEWTILRFPIRANLGDALDREAMRQKVPAINCTVTYLNTCTSSSKCTQYCERMGANSYRWFNDGCCECVGANCFNFGINESRCLHCPDDEDENGGGGGGDDDDDIAAREDGMWDYGEDEMNYN